MSTILEDIFDSPDGTELHAHNPAWSLSTAYPGIGTPQPGFKCNGANELVNVGAAGSFPAPGASYSLHSADTSGDHVITFTYKYDTGGNHNIIFCLIPNGTSPHGEQCYVLNLSNFGLVIQKKIAGANTNLLIQGASTGTKAYEIRVTDAGFVVKENGSTLLSSSDTECDRDGTQLALDGSAPMGFSGNALSALLVVSPTAPTASNFRSNADGTQILFDLSEDCGTHSNTGGFSCGGTAGTPTGCSYGGTSGTITLSPPIRWDDASPTISLVASGLSAPIVGAAGNMGDFGPEDIDNETIIQIPDPPTDADRSVSGAFVHFSWTGAIGALLYRVYQGEDLLYEGADTSFDTDELPAGTYADCEVTAVNDNGESAGTPFASFVVGEPFMPGVLSAESITSTGAVLSWTEPANGVGTVTQALYVFYPGGEDWSVLTSADTNPRTESGLTPDSVYKYRVEFNDDNGIPKFSNVVEFTTEESSAISGSGTPTAGAATAAGTGNLNEGGSGTPTGQAATVSGAGDQSMGGSGTPTGQAATAGSGGTLTIGGSGTPAAGVASASGSSDDGTILAVGNTSAGAAAVAGSGPMGMGGSGAIAGGNASAGSGGTLTVGGSGNAAAGDASAGSGGGLVIDDTITGSGDARAGNAEVEASDAPIITIDKAIGTAVCLNDSSEPARGVLVEIQVLRTPPGVMVSGSNFTGISNSMGQVAIPLPVNSYCRGREDGGKWRRFKTPEEAGYFELPSFVGARV